MSARSVRSDTTGRIAWRVQRADVNAYAGTHKPAKARPGFDLTLRPPKSAVMITYADDTNSIPPFLERERRMMRLLLPQRVFLASKFLNRCWYY